MAFEAQFKLGVTLYSFNVEYYLYRNTIDELMEKISLLGPNQGVEIVAPQFIRGFPELPKEFEFRFKRLAERYGLVPTSYGAYGDPQRFTGREMTHEEKSDYLKTQIRSAAKLGFPIIRVQFTEPVFTELVAYAEKMNVKMGIEIHAPMER